MTLNEAIEREENLAYSYGERYKRGSEPVGDLPKLEQEHKQMAEWLRELKWRRNAMAEIREAMLMPLDMAKKIYKEIKEVNADGDSN